jgi:hypothetical protein
VSSTQSASPGLPSAGGCAILDGDLPQFVPAPDERLSDVRAEVERTGTYRHTATELLRPAFRSGRAAREAREELAGRLG